MICPDCKGSGKYYGLNVIETCKKCEGKGHIYDEPVPDAGESWITAIYYGFPIDSPLTEEVTMVGNTRYWQDFQKLNVSVDLGREALIELGRRGPYHRFVNFDKEMEGKN